MSTRRLKRTFDSETGVFTFDIDKGAAVVTLSLADLSQEMINRLAGAGINQTAGDSVASLTKKGSAEAIAEALTARCETLKSGDWASRSGGGVPRTTLLAKAIAQVKGISVEEVNTKLSEASDDTKKALRKNSQVVAAMADIKAKEAATAAKDAKKSAGDDGDLDF